MEGFSIKLGVPKVGWLPVDITSGEYVLSLEVSDLGLNAVDQLITATMNLSNGKSSETYFYLEPGAYYLTFVPTSGTTHIKIDFVDDFDDEQSIRTTQHTSEMPTHEVYTALLTALQQFLAYSYNEEDWPVCENRYLM